MPRSSLYRWEKQPEPRSKRPRRTRPKSWPPDLVEAVEQLRLDRPMWGRASSARSCGARAWRPWTPPSGGSSPTWSSAASSSPCPPCAAARAARRAPGDASTDPPAQGPQGHRASSCKWIRSPSTCGDRAVKQFTAYDPVARHTAAHAFSRATAPCAPSASSTSSSKPCPSRSPASRSTAAPSSWPPYGALAGRRIPIQPQPTRPSRVSYVLIPDNTWTCFESAIYSNGRRRLTCGAVRHTCSDHAAPAAAGVRENFCSISME